MGYSLWILAIFGNFQNALILTKIVVFSSRFFAQNNFNVFVETFFACFRLFYFLTRTEYFAWAIFGNFQNGHIIRILAVSFQLICVCKDVFRLFWGILRKGHNPRKILSLGQKIKLPLTCQKRLYKHIKVVLCKKRLEKTANIGKMRAF